MRHSAFFALLLGVALNASLPAQEFRGLATFTGRMSATGAVSTAPVKVTASLPGTCGQGEAVFLTSAAAGRWHHICTATNTWTAQTPENLLYSTSTYADPSWITGLAWSKLTGVPSTFTPATHTHNTSDLNAGTLPMARGGTGRTSWTVGRCVQVAADGLSLEPSSEPCGGVTVPLSAANGGLGTNASAFAGVVRMSGGVASVVPGTATHCVLVNGTSAECGTGGGGTPQVNGTFAFTAVTTLDINHNYATKALVLSFYDSNDVLFYPNSISHISVDTTRVTFSPAATGYAIVNRAGWSGDVLGEESTVPLNSGAGAQVLKTATNVVGRTLVAGANVTITQGEDIITIAATAGEGGGGLSTVETGDGLLGVGTLADPVRVDPALVPMMMTVAETVNDWGTIGAASCVEKVMSFPGAITGDAPTISWPAALPNGLNPSARVTAINQVTLRLCNATGAGVAVANGFQFGAMILRSF